MTNKELCERYPFLLPRNRFTGEVVEDYDYSYTELDAMDRGWRKAFGERMCEEIRDALIEADYLDEYRVAQIKEKYGELRWYDFGAPQSVHDIIEKYSYISRFICTHCGSIYGKEFSGGWIYTICENCAKNDWGTTRDQWVEATREHTAIKKSIKINCYSKDGEYSRQIVIWDTWCAIVEDYLREKYLQHEIN